MLADHSLPGRTAAGRLSGPEPLAGVITGSGADPETVAALEGAGASVVAAAPLSQ